MTWSQDSPAGHSLDLKPAPLHAAHLVAHLVTHAGRLLRQPLLAACPDDAHAARIFESLGPRVERLQQFVNMGVLADVAQTRKVEPRRAGVRPATGAAAPPGAPMPGSMSASQ